MGMRSWAASAGLSLFAAACGAQAWAADKAEQIVGRPSGGIGLQPGVTELRADQIRFHNLILMPIITGITLLVLVLLLWVMIRYNKKTNPTPARWSHNTFVEIIWTVVPVLILMFIAIFSFPLLFKEHKLPGKPDITVKATGYQWYWGYSYADPKIPSEITSNMSKPEQTTPDLYRLAVDNPMVVPVNKLVRVEVTGADVIHSFSVPAFGIKIDAVPGKLNETFFKATRVGTYYGQCSQLCGVDHGFMPIQVNVVSDADFAAFVAAHHGTLPGSTPAATKPDVGASPAAAAATAQQNAAAVGAAGAAPAAAPPAKAPTAASTPPAKQQSPAGAVPAPAVKK